MDTTRTQNHRMMRLEGTSVGHIDQTAQAESPRAGCPGPCPDVFRISPRREFPQALWAICASAPSSSQ